MDSNHALQIKKSIQTPYIKLKDDDKYHKHAHNSCLSTTESKCLEVIEFAITSALCSKQQQFSILYVLLSLTRLCTLLCLLFREIRFLYYSLSYFHSLAKKWLVPGTHAIH